MFHMGWLLTDLIRASKRNLNTRVKGEETEIEGEKKQNSKVMIVVVTNPVVLD